MAKFVNKLDHRQKQFVKPEPCRVIKQDLIKKAAPQRPQKRLIMLKRRLDHLLSEKDVWETKNKELLDNLQAEKMVSASLRRENFHWQRLYHESTITLNSYKVKEADMTKVLSACLREIDTVFPNLVNFSEMVTSNKVRITQLVHSLSSDLVSLPRHLQGSRDAPSIKSGKPTKDRVNPVNPMVRGLLISKPKIMLERLMLPLQAQEPEPDNNNTMILSPIDGTNGLSPIEEENIQHESIELRHVSVRPKKRKLGWRMRNQEKIPKETHNRLKKTPAPASSYDDDSSESGSNGPHITHMEPVVRFRDFSRMLQNSSLIKVDGPRSGDGDLGSGCRQSDSQPRNSMSRAVDDPLEGSSWMFSNNQRPTNRNSYRHLPNLDRRSSLYKSDTSDEENEVSAEKSLNISAMNSLISPRNRMFPVETPDKAKSQSAENSYSSLIMAEPDSTNNIDAGSMNSTVINPRNISNILNFSLRDMDLYNEHEIDRNSKKHRLSKNDTPNSLQASFTRDGLTSSSSRSSLINKTNVVSSESNTSGLPSKRMRKPKNPLYPGEEEHINHINESSKKKTNTVVKTKKKSLSNKTKERKSVNLKSRVSTANGGSDVGGYKEHSDSFFQKTKGKKMSGSLPNEQTSKKSIKNQSLVTPRNSTAETSNDGAEKKSKRSRKLICYKESPLNVKQRRS